MSTHLKEKEERILETLERLGQESSRGTPVVVEGKNDTQALRVLNIKGRIVEAKTSGKSLLDVVSELEESGAEEAILLMDFDRRGREWTKRLKRDLEKTQIRPNLFFWKRLRSFVGREVKDVQGLTSYMETLKKKIS